MWFNQYPYINLNDLNLDFILKAIRELKYEVENFVSINAIKYADPIQWDITRQYEKNTVVIDPVTGTAYLSVAPVPAGVSLSRDEYWTVIFDLQTFVTRVNQNLTSRYEMETTTTATFSTSAGDWLVWGDVLYKALVNITAGDAYVVNSNIEHFTIEDIYHEYLLEVANIIATIGDLVDLNTADKTSIVNAINEVVGNIGDITTLATTDKTSVVNAINEVVGAIGDVDERIDNLDVFNVRDYGAVGDNVADDTAALQAAVAAVNARGGILYFPVGAYTTTQTLVITHNGVIVRGAAPNNSYLIVKDDVTGIQFLGDANSIKSGCGMQDIGVSYLGVAPSTHYGIDIEYGVNDYFKNVIVGGFKKGVYSVHMGNTFFDACGVVSSVSGAIGFDIGDRSVSIALTNCYVGFSGNAVDNGIGYLANRGDVADFTLRYFDVGNGGYGVYIDGNDSPAQYPPADIRLFDIVTDGCRVAGIRIQNINERGSVEIANGWFNEQPDQTPNAVCISLDNVNNISIHDCTLQELTNAVSTISGVAVNVGTHINIVNNKFINILRPLSLNSSDRCIISNNMINGYTGLTNLSYAISLTNAYENSVVGNQIYTPYIVGVNSSGGDYNIITNNIIRGVTTDINDNSAHSIILNNLPNANAYQFIAFGTTANRPANPVNGQMYFDNSLGVPIWSKNGVWVRSDGTSA